MIACEVFLRHVDAYVDGEVDPTSVLELEQHMSVCSDCRDATRAAEALKHEVRRAMESTPAPPPHLPARIRAALDVEDHHRADVAHEEAPVTPPWVLRGRYAVPAATAAAVALAVLAVRETGQGDGEVGIQELGAVPAVTAEDFAQVHLAQQPVEVEGEPVVVQGWMNQHLAFPVRALEFGRPDIRLVGGRLTTVRGRDAATLYYDHHGRRLTVTVFTGPPAPARDLRFTQIRGRGIYYGSAHGYTVPVFQHNGLSYALTGDVDERTLMQLAVRARVADAVTH